MPGNPLTWHSAAISHVGKVRKLNEDACIERSDIGLWAVADGMGGHSSGDLASQLIVNALAKLKPVAPLSALVDFVEHALVAVNNRLFELSQAQRQTIGSTVVTLLIAERHCVFLWAGDSRLYRLRDGVLRQLTTDHSQVELYIEKGLLSREAALEHPAGNLVTRAVGAAQDLFLDIDGGDVRAGDRFLLCSDGLDKHVKAGEVERILQAGDARTAAQTLVDTTLARGAADNITVCVVLVE